MEQDLNEPHGMVKLSKIGRELWELTFITQAEGWTGGRGTRDQAVRPEEKRPPGAFQGKQTVFEENEYFHSNFLLLKLNFRENLSSLQK